MKGKQVLLILIVGVLSALINPAHSLGQSWPVERGDPSHRASVNEAPPAFPLSLKWKTQLKGPMYSSPVAQLSQDNLYIGSNARKLWALNPSSGEIKWIFEAAEGVWEGEIWGCAAAISVPDGTGGSIEMLFVTASGGRLYSLDPASGQEIWRVEGEGAFVSSPNYADGKIFYMYGGLGSALRAVDAGTGEILWETGSSNISTAPPAVGQGAMYLGRYSQGMADFAAIDPDTGQIRDSLIADWWMNDGAFTSGVPDYGRPIYNEDCVRIGDRVYMSTKKGIVSAVKIPYDADQAPYEWESSLESPHEITGFALTSGRGAANVLVASQPDALQALNPSTGHVRWRYSFPRGVSVNQKTPQPAIWGDFVFHVVPGAGMSSLVALSLTNGTVEWSFDLDAGSYSSPAIAGDHIYIADNEGMVYAFSGEPRNDPYPVRPLHMWVASKPNAVRQYDGRTGFHIRDYVPWPPMLSDRPWDLTFGTDGLIYVSYFDSDVVKRFNRYNGSYAGNFFQPGLGGLDGPTGLRFGPDGDLYVGSLWNHRVKRYGYDAEGNVIYKGDFAAVAGPTWLCWLGDLFVSNSHADSIQRFDPGGQQKADFVLPRSGGLSYPYGMVFAADRNLYVASFGTDEIKCYDGTDGTFIRNVVGAGRGGLDGPVDLQIDSELRVTSYLTNEVKRYDPVTGEYLGNLVEACSTRLHRPMGLRLMLIFNP